MGAVRLSSILFLTAVAAAQISPEPTFRSDTSLVQVIVAARDSYGKPLTDLKREDFELFDNGKRRAIDLFVTSAEEEARRKNAQRLPDGVFTNRMTTPSDAPRRGPTVFLLDWLNTVMNTQARSRAKAIDALRAMPSDEYAAVFVLTPQQLHMVHDFTTNHAALAEALNAFRMRASEQNALPQVSAEEEERDKRMRAPVPAGLAALNRFQRTQGVIECLELFARQLAAVPGRKTLVWISAGFPLTGAERNPNDFTSEMDRAVRRLNSADIAVYAVDARGLIAGNSRGTDPAWTNADAMWRISTRTGGQLYYNRNDIDTAIQEAAGDLRMSYTLGYYTSMDSGKPSDHRIRVRVLRKGVDLGYRQSYSPEQAMPAKALAGADDPAGIVLTATATRRADTLSLALRLDARSLTLRETNGRWKGSAEIGMQYARADGKEANEAAEKAMAIDLTPDNYAKFLTDGFEYSVTLSIPPEAAVLYLRVRDEGSGRVGILSIPLGLVREADSGGARAGAIAIHY